MQSQKLLSKKGRIRSLVSRRSQWRQKARQLVNEPRPFGSNEEWFAKKHTRCVDEIIAIENELAELRK